MKWLFALLPVALLPAALLAVVLLAASCGSGETPAVPGSDLQLEVTASVSEVEFGEPFEVVIRKVWPRDHELQPFNDSVLAPLLLEPFQRDRRKLGQLFVDEVRYRARTFEVGEVTVAAPELVVKAKDGTLRRVKGNELQLQLKSSLVGAAPAVEFPELLELPPGSNWWIWLLGVVVVGGLATGFVRFVRFVRKGAGPPPAEVEVPAGPSPQPRALARLRSLAGQEPADWVALQAFYLEVTAAVRDYLAGSRARRAREMTTEELLDAVPSDSLRRCLRHCDLVKFAHVEPSRQQRLTAVDDAIAFLESEASA